MPLVQESNYRKSARFLINGHFETIYPALMRKVARVKYIRERIDTPDNDFLDLDWSVCRHDQLVIVSHGLEGDSKRPYVKGIVKAFNDHGFDALAWNFRGCSGETNRLRRFYHSGATEDLITVINHAKQKGYQQIFLIGFSLGGNMTLKYLGEGNVDPVIKGSVVFSVPLDLHKVCIQISRPSNKVYSRRFLNSLIKKIRVKARVRDDLDTDGLSKIKTLMQFDDQYTAPLHGFKNAIHYYEQCSSIRFLNSINIPTLLVNAKNDPFLSKECYPMERLSKHRHIYLEVPDIGGHVGFYAADKGYYWSELRALEFIKGIGALVT